MRMIHKDDLANRLRPEYRGYVLKFLEQIGGIICVPDRVTIPNNAMPGTFAERPGRFGQDEPFPPYEEQRQLLEDANRLAALSDQELRDEIDKHEVETEEHERLMREAARRELEL